MTDRLAKFLSVGCGLLLAFGAGVIASEDDLGPNAPVAEAYHETKNLLHNWRNDLGFAPERVLVPADQPDRGRMTVHRPDGATPGYRLISGVSGDKDSRFGVYLFDEAGREVHFWPIRYNDFTPGEITERNVFQHGMQPLPDGSIVVTFDNGDAIARIGACGETLWVVPGRFHHAVDRAYDGTVWAWQGETPPEEDQDTTFLTEFMVQLDPEDGSILRRVDLLRDVIVRHGAFGRFALHAAPEPDRIAFQSDPFHPNDIEVLSPEMADAFPDFAAGDLLISLRALNMIAVLDGGDYAVKWSQIGPWHRQHDPDFQPDGTISLFDNRMGLGASRILSVNPATGAVSTLYEGSDQDTFYTWQRGSHEILPNGHVVVTETEAGRAFEVDPSGNRIWTFENVFDAKRNGLVNYATVLPTTYFEDHAFTRCGESIAATQTR